jgi:hypothetical protein
MTNGNGGYKIENVPPGDYTLEVTKDGYSPYREQITVYPGNNRLDAGLMQSFSLLTIITLIFFIVAIVIIFALIAYASVLRKKASRAASNRGFDMKPPTRPTPSHPISQHSQQSNQPVIQPVYTKGPVLEEVPAPRYRPLPPPPQRSFQPPVQPSYASSVAPGPKIAEVPAPVPIYLPVQQKAEEPPGNLDRYSESQPPSQSVKPSPVMMQDSNRPDQKTLKETINTYVKNKGESGKGTGAFEEVASPVVEIATPEKNQRGKRPGRVDENPRSLCLHCGRMNDIDDRKCFWCGQEL